MFSSIKRLLMPPDVIERGDEMIITGIDGPKLAASIRRHWKSSRIDTYLFNKVDRNSVSFYQFFAPDVLFTLEQLSEGRSLRVPAKVINKVRMLMLTKTWLGQAKEPQPERMNYKQLEKFTLQPLDFQQRFLEEYDRQTQAWRLKGLLLAGTAGSGKTLSSLYVQECMELEVSIILCPKAAVHEVWTKTLATRFHQAPSTCCLTDFQPYTGQRYIVAHYEMLPALIALLPKLKGKKVGIILDESHNFNEIKTARPHTFIEFCQSSGSENILWLSGTPFKAVTREAIPFFRCVDAAFTPEVEERFKKIYKDSNDRGVEIIRARLGMVSYKVVKDQLNLEKPDMPAMPIQMPNGHAYTLPEVKKRMQEYNAARSKYYEENAQYYKDLFFQGLQAYEKTIRTSTERQAYQDYRRDLETVKRLFGQDCPEQMTHVNQFELKRIYPILDKPFNQVWRSGRSAYKYPGLKVQGEVLGRVVGKMRMECHRDMVAHIPFQDVCDSTLKKTVVFTSYVEVLETIEQVLQPTRLNPVLVYGKTNHELVSIVSRFENDEDVNPLAATYKSLSTAVPLTMADTMILVDHPFRDYTLQQAISRINRLGATTRSIIHRAELDTGDVANLSTRNLDILAWSQKQIKEIFGVESPFQIVEDAVTQLSTENHAGEQSCDETKLFDAITIACEGYDQWEQTRENKSLPASMTTSW